jgi:hypothetical protein
MLVCLSNFFFANYFGTFDHVEFGVDRSWGMEFSYVSIGVVGFLFDIVSFVRVGRAGMPSVLLGGRGSFSLTSAAASPPGSSRRWLEQ